MFRAGWVAALVVLQMVGVPTRSAAGDFVFGLGAARYPLEDSAFGELQYYASPFANWWGIEFSLGAGAVITENRSSWIGAGFAAVRPFQNGWFIEGSFMPGYYDAKDDFEEIGNHLEFRTQIGIGREINERTAVSLAVSHISNGGIDLFNPGIDAVSLRLWRAFD